jgi:ABC-type Fe3+/spermidine/putrescine transport system ATPase subunit
VEINLNFFILEGLVVPDLPEEDFEAVAEAAARLSCVDERFADVAEAMGIEPGPLSDDERERLRVEIDARVARAWSLTAEDLEVLLADFTLDAVPANYRRHLAERLDDLVT